MKAMSFETPRSLQNMVFFYTGLHFSLRGGQEQRDLKVDQFKRFPEDPGVYNESTYYQYVEFIAKNNQHRFKDAHGKTKLFERMQCLNQPDTSTRFWTSI